MNYENLSTSTRDLIHGVAPANAADNLNHLRYIRQTFINLHEREEDPQQQQVLMDIITHLEAAMDIMYRLSVRRDF
jgi:ethanolamine ammonia-lyase large subunit